MNKMPVKEHLQNPALYRPLDVPLHSSNWKRRLFYQYGMQKQLKDALQYRNFFLVPACIVLPVGCICLVLASFFGVLPLGQWFEALFVKSFLVTHPIGLKEILVFAAVVNALTFLSMKKNFFS